MSGLYGRYTATFTRQKYMLLFKSARRLSTKTEDILKITMPSAMLYRSAVTFSHAQLVSSIK